MLTDNQEHCFFVAVHLDFGERLQRRERLQAPHAQQAVHRSPGLPERRPAGTDRGADPA